MRRTSRAERPRWKLVTREEEEGEGVGLGSEQKVLKGKARWNGGLRSSHFISFLPLLFSSFSYFLSHTGSIGRTHFSHICTLARQQLFVFRVFVKRQFTLMN